MEPRSMTFVTTRHSRCKHHSALAVPKVHPSSFALHPSPLTITHTHPYTRFNKPLMRTRELTERRKVPAYARGTFRKHLYHLYVYRFRSWFRQWSHAP